MLPAVYELVKALTHEKAGVRAAAVFALGEVRDPTEAVVHGVTKTLGDPDESVRQLAVASLESLSRCDDENVRRAAEEALGSAGGEAQRRLSPSGRRFR